MFRYLKDLWNCFRGRHMWWYRSGRQECLCCKKKRVFIASTTAVVDTAVKVKKES